MTATVPSALPRTAPAARAVASLPQGRLPLPRIVLAMLCAAALLVAAGCRSSDPQARLARFAPDALYAQAAKSMRASDYGQAVRVYEALTARYPFTDQARQARLDLIYCYYKLDEKESTTDAADTFVRENPTHPRVDYAWYIRGLVEFERTPHKVERLMRIDLSERPPNTAEKSFNAFRTVVERYPKSVYAPDARRRMIYLRNRLADYEIQVARYYVQRNGWVAAAQRARQAVERYDGAPAVREALQIMIQAYAELGYSELEANTRKVYETNFPEAPSPEGRRRTWWKVWDRG
jgi:outer membrane protein assembly factor BamD